MEELIQGRTHFRAGTLVEIYSDVLETFEI